MDHKSTLNAFMQAWKDQDYDKMHELSQLTWKDGKDSEMVMLQFSPFKLKKFVVISTTYVSSSCWRYNVDITLENGARVLSAVNVICEVAPGKPAPFGTWGVNPASAQNVLANIPAKKPWKKPEVKPATKEQGKKVKSNARK